VNEKKKKKKKNLKHELKLFYQHKDTARVSVNINQISTPDLEKIDRGPIGRFSLADLNTNKDSIFIKTKQLPTKRTETRYSPLSTKFHKQTKAHLLSTLTHLNGKRIAQEIDQTGECSKH